MRIPVLYFSLLIGVLVLAFGFKQTQASQACWCWSQGQGMVAGPIPHPPSKEYESYGSYGTEADWNDSSHLLPLNYEQTQGKRIFYQQCVWCHADTTPAGPSNRSNVTPTPSLMDDGATLNKMKDEAIIRIIAEGGRKVGRSAMMPPYGGTLSQGDMQSLVAYIRVIASPPYSTAASSATGSPEANKK